VLTSTADAQPALEQVLIRAPKPYTNLISAIRARGGRVTRQFRYVDAVAAEIPRNAFEAISALASDGTITKDLVLPSPVPVDTLRARNLARSGDENAMRFETTRPLSAAQLSALAVANPNAYLLNNAISKASALHANGIAGQGIVVAVIDSGIRPGFPHISLDNAVIGCEDFIGDALGCSNFANNGHGTFVAGMITASVLFAFPPADPFRNAVLAECPACFLDPPANTQVPMIGSAPLAGIYALRVLPPSGGAPTSRVIAAIERVIELREKYDAGDPGGVNIQVANLSLGGFTLNAGHDPFDQAVNLLLEKGIVPVIAAGNTGPATLTNSSPATAIGAIAVGAASLAHNERILRRAQLGPLLGSLYRPFLGTQTAYFSSRGPNADGRVDPDVVINGFACYGQGLGPTTNAISLGSGTSFSSPSIAGVAALLRQAFPNATPRQIRNAIVMSANPGLIEDGSGPVDRGAGYADALAAFNLLAQGKVPNTTLETGNPTKQVAVNVRHGTDLRVDTGVVQQTIANLRPGQRHDILYQVLPNTSQVIIQLTNVTPSLPPSQQNQLFGDDILLAIHTAKTSAIGATGDYVRFLFTTGGTFVVNNPELGIMRISVNGDWTNAGNISSDVTVLFVKQPLPGFTEQGKILQGQLVQVPFNVPAGTAEANFRLEWREDWSNYPTNDLDLILVSPTGTVNFSGATLNNPELATLLNPTAGTWRALIHGYEVNTKSDKYELRVMLDGRIIR
jgi:subtilisin family serine protease